jgi:exodeoxyribonuclease VII large subunit
MARTVKSQWNFGELFPREPARRVFTVAELTGAVKAALERALGRVWVTGEVSNLRLQSSGHCYFTLKDATAQLSCVLFRGTDTPHRAVLEDGLKLVVEGDLTVYEPRGQYQLVVRQLELQGVGALQLAFERLKARLQAEGMFAAERKRAVPRLIQRLGIVTSITGAALRDVLHVVQRRNPALEIVVAPCRVQGDGAATEIARSIQWLNEWSQGEGEGRRIEAILVTRGGGSLEDLWAFNEETVARAIASSTLPVVSAVGHEIDFTISDFVADLRAATPSAAAELLTEGVFASRLFVAEAPALLARVVRTRLSGRLEGLSRLRARLERVHPRRQLEVRLQQLDDLQVGLGRVMRLALAARRGEWETLRGRWRSLHPVRVMRQMRDRASDAERRLSEQTCRRLETMRTDLQRLESGLRWLSPLGVLERGYSLTTDAATGEVVREAARVRVGQRLRTRLRRGEIRSVVEHGTADLQPGSAAGPPNPAR